MEKEREILTYKADERMLCQKCDGEMHWCHENRCSGYTLSEPPKLYKGCAAKGVRHPKENVFICLFCDVVVPTTT